jgi:hypothetical protein
MTNSLNQLESRVNWKRIFAWSTLIYAIALIVGFSLGTDRASTTGVFVSSSTLYFYFLRPFRQGRLRHAIAAFLLVEAVDWSIPLIFGAPVSYMLDNWASSVRHLGAALFGLTAAWLSSKSSVKPRPLHGSA